MSVFRGSAAWAVLWLAMGGGVAYLAALPVGLDLQARVAAVVLVGLAILRKLPRLGLFRVLFLCLAAFILLRYLFWRTLHTLGYDDFFSFVAALILYGAELYGIAMFLLSAFVNVRPIRRVRALESGDWPTVDVYIPTYNEPLEIVKTTLVAAMALDYPADRLNVYLLDDGSTWARRHSRDPEVAAAARQRHAQMRALCRDLGAHYLTRRRNDHAKAGNLNAALPRTAGSLIAVLDCDHVPTVDFLRETVPPLVRNPDLFLVQTPHFFVTPDPIEKNLDLFNRMPSENDMFYEAIQPGLDFWGASFFCGSAAVLRRRALEENGGFSGKSVTEDAETALALHARGWRSWYVLKPMISGLQPETFGSFVSQRIRWAQGMVQLFLLDNPLRRNGLALSQKLAYLNCMLFWFFPFARVVFLLAPLCFLIFGLRIYDAGVEEILAYTVPYLVTLVLTANYLFGRVRWFLISEIYESMQSFFSLPAVISVLRTPRRPRFKVTPKGERLDEDFISPLVTPFYVLLVLLCLGFVAAVLRWQMFPEYRPLILITSFWCVANFLIVIASLGALYERRQRRRHPRLPADDLPARLILDGQAYSVTFHDISTGGAALLGMPERKIRHSVGVLKLWHPLLQRPCAFSVEVLGQYHSSRGVVTGVRFLPESLQAYRDIVLLVHGDSRRWQRLLRLRDRDIGILPALGFLLSRGVRQAGLHIATLFVSIRRRSQDAESRAPAAGGDDHPGDGRRSVPRGGEVEPTLVPANVTARTCEAGERVG